MYQLGSLHRDRISTIDKQSVCAKEHASYKGYKTDGKLPLLFSGYYPKDYSDKSDNDNSITILKKYQFQ